LITTQYYRVLLFDAETRQGLLEAAQLAQWTDTLVEKLQPRLNDIIARYWAPHLTDKEKKLLGWIAGTRRVSQSSSDDDASSRSLTNMVSIASTASSDTSRRRGVTGFAARVLEVGLGKIAFALQQASQTSMLWMARRLDVNTMPNSFAHIRALALTIRHVLAHELNPTDFVDIGDISLNPEIGLNIRSLPKSMQDLFHAGILGYFNKAPMVTVGRIVGGIFALTPEESTNDLILMRTVMNRVGYGSCRLFEANLA
jgi:hypothetical protein